MQRTRDFASGLVNVYGAGNVHALRKLKCDGLDTVGVWGSNPHAPTNFLISQISQDAEIGHPYGLFWKFADVKAYEGSRT